MFCTNCGAQIPDNSSFCPTCGANLQQSAAFQQGVTSTQGAAFQQGAATPSYGTAAATDYSAANVPDYLVWNILATIFCCLPLGIVGIVYSSKVNGAKARNDYQAAEAASSTAKTWLIVNVVLGAVMILAYLGIAVLGAAIEGNVFL